jgi:purine-binding chemotaxis protein CheW
MSTVHVRVQVAGEQYALAVGEVAEVVELGHLTPVPGAREPLLGLCNLRGEIISVVDLAAVLRLSSEGRATRMLIATHGGRRAGLAIDEVLDVAPLPECTPEQGLGCISATTVVEGALVGVIDAGALLDAAAQGAA